MCVSKPLPASRGCFVQVINKMLVMLRYEASSSLCITALFLEEDPSLSLRMTNVHRFYCDINPNKHVFIAPAHAF
jgi:hypothetical protein